MYRRTIKPYSCTVSVKAFPTVRTTRSIITPEFTYCCLYLQWAMPRYCHCVAPGCPSSVTPKGLNKYKGTMHKFPDEHRCVDQFQQWACFCGQTPEWRPSSSQYLCAEHFDTSFKVLKIKPVPTILVRDEDDNSVRLSPNLPLDATLEFIEDTDPNETLSFSPTKIDWPNSGHNCR